MKINLITQDQYNTILKIKEERKILTFENKGYQYVTGLTDEDKEAVRTVSDILKNHIVGFSEFNNFRDRDGRVQLRIQYNWGAEDHSMYFTGVGYLYLDELLNGFDKN